MDKLFAYCFTYMFFFCMFHIFESVLYKFIFYQENWIKFFFSFFVWLKLNKKKNTFLSPGMIIVDWSCDIPYLLNFIIEKIKKNEIKENGIRQH